jgi:hypothetical protein
VLAPVAVPISTNEPRSPDHPHAIRILGRGWPRIIWRLWHDRTTYDPNHHGKLNRLLAARG